MRPSISRRGSLGSARACAAPDGHARAGSRGGPPRIAEPPSAASDVVPEGGARRPRLEA